MLPTDLNWTNTAYFMELILKLFSLDAFQAGLIDLFQLQRHPRLSSRNL